MILARTDPRQQPRRVAERPFEPRWSAVVIRIATTADESSLRRLAELDSAPPLQEPSLVAELREQVVAAVSLQDGRAIADPFCATADVLELLRVRAAQLDRSPAVRRMPAARRA